MPDYIITLFTIFKNFLQPFSEEIPGRRYGPQPLIPLSKVLSLSTLQILYIFFPLPRDAQKRSGRSSALLLCVPSQAQLGVPKAHSSPDRAAPQLLRIQSGGLHAKDEVPGQVRRAPGTANPTTPPAGMPQEAKGRMSEGDKHRVQPPSVCSSVGS